MTHPAYPTIAVVAFDSRIRSDRFGRVNDSYWYEYGAAKDVDRIEYGHDRTSNRICTNNTVATSANNTVQENQYDGCNFRVVRKDYSAGMLTDTRHFYYTSAWQMLEERVDSSASPNRQFAWGLRYIDDYVLRDCDTSGSGTLDARPSGVEARARLYGYHFGRVEVGHMWNAHEVRRARINRNASQPRETDGWPQSHGGCRYALQGIQAVANSVSLDSAER